MKSATSRRRFLQSSKALVALPFLESLGFRRFASAATPRPPQRLVFLAMGYGVTEDAWFPDVKQTGADYELPPGLMPLARHKADFTVVQGASHHFTSEGHWGSTYWLTGASRYGDGGSSFHNSISADQVAAAHVGQQTRFASLQLNGSEKTIAEAGHGPGLSLAWDVRGKPMGGLDSPLATYHRLFSRENVSLDERQAMLTQKRSVMDAVLEDARDLKRRLGRTDKNKLEEYFQGIRDIETRLSKDELWQDKPKPEAPLLQPPEAGLKGLEEIKLMYDLMLAALETDSTRVITYRQPIADLLTSLGIKVAAHDMSHYTPGIRREASLRRDEANSDLLAGLIDRLKATREADGSRLFDHTAVVFGSNLRTVHNVDDCPTILTGGGAGMQLGKNLVLRQGTPLCNIWLTLLRGIGAPVKRHGDSTGVISELLG